MRQRSKSASDVESQQFAASGRLINTRLSELPLFRGLEPSLIDKMAKIMHLRVYRKDDLIIREGHVGRSLFILLSGAALVYSEKSECILSIMSSGAVFGEIGALYDSTRTATVRASSVICKVAVMNQDDLSGLFKHSPQLLGRLRERAMMHLRSDFYRVDRSENVALKVGDMKVFKEYASYKDETIRLFLADAKCIRIPKGERVPLDAESTVCLLVKGEGYLCNTLGKNVSVSSGFIMHKDDIDETFASRVSQFDYFQSETSCVLILTPIDIYEYFLKGLSVYKEEIWEEPPSIVPVERTLMTSHPKRSSAGQDSSIEEGQAELSARRDRKRTRVSEEVCVDYSKNPSTVTNHMIKALGNIVVSLSLEGCWQLSDEGLNFICSRMQDSLKNLVISDCWNFTVESLNNLGDLKSLKSLFMANLEVDDHLIEKLPASLEQLDVSFCSKINDFGCFSHLTNLKKLSIRHCNMLTASDSLPSRLYELDCSKCHLLKDEILAKGLGNCKDLQVLSLSSCHSLTANCLGALLKLSSLKCLNISNCDNVANDLSVGLLLEKLPSLTGLDVSHNANIHELWRLVSNTKNLKTLKFHHCNGLDERQHAILNSRYASEL